MRRIFFALAMIFALPACAIENPAPAEAPQMRETMNEWQKVITDFDQQRLARYDAAVAAGTMEASIAKEPAGDMAELLNVMEAETIPIDLPAMAGKWKCRTLKAGGPFVGLVVYSWFNCDITMKDGRPFYEKLSGSQRQSGFIYQRDARTALLLAAPNKDHSGPIRAYSGPQGGITDPQLQDELGVISQLKDGRLRIVFPYPVLESTYNVLELKRR
ncbi:MAG: DUF4893 domain-containing protein [Rhizobiales bacterium]|nr:DUF4893 domain-containing protein [Hyphomicrobiales bacterium]